MKRREFLVKSGAASASLVALSACKGGGSGYKSPPESGDIGQAAAGQDAVDKIQTVQAQMPSWAGPSPFKHGVASGDPWPRQVILWTRISAEGLDDWMITAGATPCTAPMATFRNATVNTRLSVYGMTMRLQMIHGKMVQRITARTRASSLTVNAQP